MKIPIFNNSASKSITLLLALYFLCSCSPSAKKSRVLERADRYFKAGEYDKAKIEYLNLLRLDHQNVTAFQQLGIIWSEQGVPLRAIPFLLKVRELAPQNIGARSKLALAFMALGQRVEARKEAMTILQQDPGNSDAIILFSDTSQTKEEIAAAEQELEKFPQKNTVTFHLASASLSIRKGKVGAAADEVQQALAADSKSARAHLVMGYIYMLRKNPDRAGTELKTASDLALVRSEERIKYAEFQAANGASDQARVLLQDITKPAPDYVPAWRDLAQIALTGKKYDEALSLLENIFSRDPDNPEARVVQAQVQMEKGNPEKAIAILDKLNAAHHNNALLKYQLARAYVLNKNLGQAAGALEQAIAAQPDYAEAILLLGELNLRAGRVQPVVIAMEDLRKKRPDLPQTRVLLASAYQVLGRLEEAALLFREQLRVAPQSAGDHFLLGAILRQQNKAGEARAEFEKALELTPDNWRGIDQLVDMDLAEKQYDAATQRAQQYLEKKPDDAGGHFMRGKIYATQKDWTHAESELQKAIDLDPNLSPAYSGLVSAYIAQNKLEQAVTQLESALKKSPDNPRALLTLGLLYDQIKNYPKARDTYEKLLATSPNTIIALNNLAVIYVDRLNNLDKAYALAQKARTLAPNEASVADSLGWVLYKRGEFQQALALLQESTSKFPASPEVQFHLGMTASMMGQTDVARAALEKAVQATADFPGKDEAQRRLASLQISSSQTSEPRAGDLAALQKEQPNDVLALTRLAEAYEKKGAAAQAAEAYEHVLKLNPKLLSAVLKLAQLYAGPLQSHDKALEFAKKARDLAPNDTEAADVLGRVAYQAGNFGWAYSLLQERARRNSNDSAVLHDLALAAYALGKVPEARQTMERVANMGPDAARSEDAKKFLAMTALDRVSADVVRALPEVHKILKDEPEYVPAMMAQAAIELQHKRGEAAAEIYSRVLQKYPDFAPAQKKLAAIYGGNPENLAKAYDLAMKARKMFPQDPELARTLAEISFQRKEFPYAIQLFRESAAKSPLPPKDMYYLGMAYHKTQRDAEGRLLLQRAIAAGLAEPLNTSARQTLNSANQADGVPKETNNDTAP